MELAKSKILFWTNHSKMKMRFYGLSESRIKRILRFPKRTEKGIALDTIAIMQAAGTAKNPYEIWVMIQYKNQKSIRQLADKNQKVIKIISAWRYPGKTKPKSGALSDILNNEYGEYNS